MNAFGIAPDGFILFGGLALLALTLFVLAFRLGRWWLWVSGYALAALALAIAFFFRDPTRVGQRGPHLYLSPADGRVLAIERVFEPEYLDTAAIRVSIYLSLLNVHVQRSPVDGVVDYVEHRAGTFAPAWSERAGENESTMIGINTGEVRVLVRQVAGTVARRIVTYVEEGDLVDQADRIGLIRFGSRVEAYLPQGVEPAVAVGDRVRAGATVLARVSTEARP